MFWMWDTRFMDRYRIASNRFRWWDYSYGRYFITICTKDMVHYFGQIIDGVMVLNDMGSVVNQCRFDIPKHFPNVQIDQFVVMPNHVHGILVLNIRRDAINIRKDAINRVSTEKNKIPWWITWNNNPMITTWLWTVIRSFKSACAYKIHKLWYNFHRQSNYYDHIIRDELWLRAIRKYIEDNPKMRYRDRNNI